MRLAALPALEAMSAFTQFRYLRADMERITKQRVWRWYAVWFMPGFLAVLTYRLNRFFYLLLGRGWKVIHTALQPVFFLLHPWSAGCEIHYMADIGPGLRIMHPSLGVVISGRTTAGKNLTLTGGNCIGMRGSVGGVLLGDHVTLGAAANILGPVTLGSNITVGMSALVVRDAGDNQTLVGVPAAPVQAKSDV